LNFFVLGVIPQSWKRYIVPKNLTVIQWITDFSDRVKQLESISKLVADQGYKSLKVNFINLTKTKQKCLFFVF
jgi:dynein heavy chain 1